MPANRLPSHDPAESGQSLGPSLTAIVLATLVLAGCGLIFGDNPPIEREDGSGSRHIPAGPPVGVIERREGDAHLTLGACDLLSAAMLNEIFGSELSTASNPIPWQNRCNWSEPLVDGYTDSEMSLVVWAPLEGARLAEEWERRPEARIEIPSVTGEERIEGTRGFFDPGTSENPHSLELDDGVIVIGAHANLHFEAFGIWFSLQPSGRMATVPELSRKLADVAAHLAWAILTW